MNKAELRPLYLAKQKMLSAEDRDRASERITENFFSSFDLGHVRVLHCFIPIKKFNEINTSLILAKLWRDFPGIQTVAPRVDPQIDAIRSLRFAPDTELVRNAWGIEEPAHDEYVEAQSIDMVLVPGLCFDSRGHRVGFGKGYYDRFLKTCRANCVKIGLSHFEPVEKIDDIYGGDVRLDAVITPDGMRNVEL